MRLVALETAFPGRAYSQGEVLELLRGAEVFRRLGRRERRILEAVLGGESGVECRHFAIEPERVFVLDAEGLNRAFEETAPPLGAAALERSLRAGGLRAADVDLMIACTCTGYLCPGLSGYIAERVGLRRDAVLWDFAGMGCGAAVPAMEAAAGFLRVNPGAVAATVAVEVCSAAFDVSSDAGTLVSACLFGDGAAAALWRAEGPAWAWRVHNFHTRTFPGERELIRFVNAGGRLRNKLEREVPAAAARAVAEVFPLRTGEPDAVIVHSGGKDVMEAVAGVLPGFDLLETREIFRRFGNLSSPSVLAAAKLRLDAARAGDRHLWLAGFGAGFSISACEWSREEDKGRGA